MPKHISEEEKLHRTRVMDVQVLMFSISNITDVLGFYKHHLVTENDR